MNIEKTNKTIKTQQISANKKIYHKGGKCLLNARNRRPNQTIKSRIC